MTKREETLLEDNQYLQTVVAEKDSLLVEKDSLLVEKDSLLVEKDSLLVEKDSQLADSKAYVDTLEEAIRNYKRILFAPKSEKRRYLNDEQLALFNEIEMLADKADQEAQKPPKKKERKKSCGRKPLPASFEREHKTVDLAKEEKICACGCKLESIGEDTAETLKPVPQRYIVVVTHRPKYVCPGCGGTESDTPDVRMAELPPRLLPKSIATPELLAQIVTAKFVDALPLYRQANIFLRHGVELSDTKMSRWMTTLAPKCEPLLNLFQKSIVENTFVNIDETPFQVLKESGRKDQTKSYMWVFRGGIRGKPAVVYKYSPTRNSTVPIEFLKGFQGYFQVDGCPSYNELGRLAGCEHVGCWNHARRYFDEALKSINPKKKKLATKSAQALDFIGEIYKIEDEGRAIADDHLMTLRKEKTVPLFAEFKNWLHKHQGTVSPKSKLGAAIKYTLNQWSKLIRFIEDPRMTPDNNRVENDIRPHALGRKNWIFAGSPRGADSSAMFYSLVETAKANGLEPYAYLRYIFEKVPFAQTEEDWQTLLPMNLTPEDIASD